jgi:hypothetical protein
MKIVADFDLRGQLAYQIANQVASLEGLVDNHGDEVDSATMDEVKAGIRTMFAHAEDDIVQIAVNKIVESPIPDDVLQKYVDFIESSPYRLVKNLMMNSVVDMSQVIAAYFQRFQRKVERLLGVGGEDFGEGE